MKNALVFSALLPLLSAASFPQPEEGRKGKEADLSITIVPSKNESGDITLPHDGVFHVLLKNTTKRPLKIWDEDCPLSFATLSFHVTERGGRSYFVQKTDRLPGKWSRRPPRVLTISGSEVHSWPVNFSDIFWGNRAWRNPPEPNSGDPVKIQARFEIKADEETGTHDVWTGSLTSKVVTVEVRNPKLKTPLDYLWNECPRQALRLLKENKDWINDRDDYELTPLHLAASFGFKSIVQWLIDNDADVDATSGNKFVPLHMTKDPQIAKLLIDAGADVDAVTAFGSTVLQNALTDLCPNHAIIKMLIDAGATYDIRAAILLGDEKRVKELLSDDASLANTKNKHGYTALHWAARKGHVGIVKLLLDHDADIEARGYLDDPPIFNAVSHPEALKVLLDAGADPEGLLHRAASRGQLESAKLLLAAGLDVDSVTEGGRTPLYGAVASSQVEMVKYLLKNKADPNGLVEKGEWRPIDVAAASMRERAWEHAEENARTKAIMEALRTAGVDFDLIAAMALGDAERVGALLRSDPSLANSRHADGFPTLHRAVGLGNKEVVKLFLDNGADVEIRDESESRGGQGSTPLHAAAFWGRAEIAQLLIGRKADVNAKDEHGSTPLHEAARLGTLEVAKLLVAAGAEINAKDDDGETPISQAGPFGKGKQTADFLRQKGGKP